MEADESFSPLPDPPPEWSLQKSLGEALYNLNITDRVELEEEIHGVRCRAVEETPQLIGLALAEFDIQVNGKKNSDPSIKVLRKVMPNNQMTNGLEPPNYLNLPEVRLRFLRSEFFNVEKAVTKFIACLEFMSEVFGEYIADRPPLISDFNTAEEAAFVSSRKSFFPFRDRSGRRILIAVGNCNFHLDVKLRYKILMFMLWTVSEDIEAQMKGLVIIAWVFDEENEKTWEKGLRPSMSSELRSYSQKLSKSIPVRVVSWQHYYRDTPFFRFLAGLYSFTVTKEYRPIYRAHFGSDLELRYKLAGFGVPVDLMPVSSTGSLKFGPHKVWINVLKEKLRMTPNNPNNREIVECPKIHDVVFKKGPATKHNIGNQKYRELIKEFSLEHFRGNRMQKYDITMIVIDEINKANGRFLKWENTMWLVYKEEEKEEVRKKIASAFKQFNRDRRPEALELVTAIDIATEIGDDEPDKPDKGAKTNSVFTLSQGPTKRIKKSPCIIDEKDDDEFCFGKCFFPTSNAMHRDISQNIEGINFPKAS